MVRQSIFEKRKGGQFIFEDEDLMRVQCLEHDAESVMEQIVNAYHIKVNKCCASCKHKESQNDGTRQCTKTGQMEILDQENEMAKRALIESYIIECV